MHLSHLDAIKSRLAREERRLELETNPAAIKLREVWVSQAKKELAAEFEFLGIDVSKPITPDEAAEMLKELGI